MAFSVNKVILLGNVGQDPELAYSQAGTAYCRFSVATNFSTKDKDGNWKNTTDWHNVVAFGNLAERCSQNLKKGSKVYVEGRIQYDDYEKDNVKRKSVSIILNDAVIIDRKENVGNTESSASKEVSNSGNQAAPASDDDLPF